jgi:hypothetical protein
VKGLTEGKLTEDQEKYVLEKMDEFYASVGVIRLDRTDGFWLKCEKCGDIWDITRPNEPAVFHWVCPKRCNV